MKRFEFTIRKRDFRHIAFGGLAGFLLLLTPLLARDIETAVLVAIAFGVPAGAAGAALACIMQRYRHRE